MFNFEKLNVYQEAILFTNTIYSVTAKWPREEIFGLTSQFRRASVSIGLNIAEGTSRTKKDFRHFLDLSKGSIYECVAILAIAKQRNYISDAEYKNAYEEIEKLSRMISKLKSSLL